MRKARESNTMAPASTDKPWNSCKTHLNTIHKSTTAPAGLRNTKASGLYRHMCKKFAVTDMQCGKRPEKELHQKKRLTGDDPASRSAHASLGVYCRSAHGEETRYTHGMHVASELPLSNKTIVCLKNRVFVAAGKNKSCIKTSSPSGFF